MIYCCNVSAAAGTFMVVQLTTTQMSLHKDYLGTCTNTQTLAITSFFIVKPSTETSIAWHY